MKTLSDRIKFLPIKEDVMKSSALDLSHIGSIVNEGKVIEVGSEIEEVKVGDIIRFSPKSPVYLNEKEIEVGFISETDVIFVRDDEKES